MTVPKAQAEPQAIGPELQTAVGQRVRRKTGRLHRSNKIGYLMVAPMICLLGIFVIVPFFQALYLSFFDFSFYLPSTFIAFRNYLNVLKDPIFIKSILQGLQFTAMVVPVGLILAFLFASVVKGVGQRLASVIKTTIYLPTIVSGVIASIIFVLIYDYYGGVLNWLLGATIGRFMNFEPIPWLGDPSIALPALAVPAIWIGFGITALIMLAGMLDIPDSYYESASLDGANWFQQMVFITIPQMKNVLIYLLIAGCTGAVQQLELPLIMTQGGPLNSTMLPDLYIFNHFTQDQRQGQPLAAALMLFVVLGAISVVIFRVINSEKSQEG